MLKQEELHLMTTFSFSHGKEQVAIALQTRKQIRQGANDLFSQRRGCQGAVLLCGSGKKICVIITSQQVVKNQQSEGEFSTNAGKIKQRKNVLM